MATINRFEDLKIWKASMDLCSTAYKLTNLDSFPKDFGLKAQIRRSSVSVPSNISKGFERDSQRQFLDFLVIAKGSCGELRIHNKIAHNPRCLNEELFENLNNECLSVSKQLAGLINYV